MIMFNKLMALCLLLLAINPCFAAYDRCPFTEEEARREGWQFRDGRPIGEDQLMYASIRKTDRGDAFRISCYYRRGYDALKKIFNPNVVIIPKSNNWTIAEGALLWCTESAKECTWQIIS